MHTDHTLRNRVLHCCSHFETHLLLYSAKCIITDTPSWVFFFFFTHVPHPSLKCVCIFIYLILYFYSGSSASKESAINAGDLASIPGSGRSPGEGNSNPFQYSCLGNPMDSGVWWATVHGVAKSWTRLSN